MLLFSPVKPQSKDSLHSKIKITDLAPKMSCKIIARGTRLKIKVFNLLSRVLFIIDEEDTRCFKSAMMFPFRDRTPFFFGL
jgi:hypothetical protein